MTFAQLVDTRPAGVILSASQIEKYDRCKRRWALEYIGGVRTPPHPSAQLGTDVHTILENWLRSAVPPDTSTKAGKIASRMISNLPPPGTGVVERQFYMVTKNGLAYTGKIDWSGIFFGAPTAIDHKTTANLEYAKTEAQLHSDLQAITYTLAGCIGFSTDEMQLLWNYGTTKSREPEVRPVYTKVRLPVVIDKFENVVEPLAEEITLARKRAADPMTFSPNPSACRDFGGCPHQSLCNLSQQERLQALMTDQPPNLATRLAGFPGNGFSPPPQNTAVFAPPAAGLPPAPVAPNTAPVPPGVVYMPQAPQMGFAPPPVPQTTFAPPPTAPQAAPQPTQATYPHPQNYGDFTPPQTAVQAPDPNQLTLSFDPDGGPNPPESGTAAAPTSPTAVAEAEPKRGRGRPRKDKSAEQPQEGAAPTAPDAVAVKKKSTFDEQQFFLAGVTSMIASPVWDGTAESAREAGELVVQLGKARYGV